MVRIVYAWLQIYLEVRNEKIAKFCGMISIYNHLYVFQYTLNVLTNLYDVFFHAFSLKRNIKPL